LTQDSLTDDVVRRRPPGEPLSAKVYEEIRTRIIVGRYPQGSRLPEQRLAEDLEVSRVPLREAIPQLESDGFVRTLPRRGAVVSTWSTKLVNDLFDARLALEVAAARRAAVRVAQGGDILALELKLAEADEEVTRGGALEVAVANAEVHQRLVEAAGNVLMSELMRAVAGRMVWFFYLTATRDPLIACAEHHEIADAIRAGNERLAEALTFAHIESGREPSLAAVASLLTE
jgi:DNA-binding GntR family transcriptional regulator